VAKTTKSTKYAAVKKFSGHPDHPIAGDRDSLESYEITYHDNSTRVVRAAGVDVDDEGRLLICDEDGTTLGIFKEWKSIAPTSLLRETGQALGDIARAKADENDDEDTDEEQPEA
jgi:hypothetical protein